MKGILKVMGIIIGLIIIFIGVSYINHRIHLSKEDELFVPNGEMVEVNGHQMYIYTEGEGDKTLVFMSGGGTCSPTLDFKSLYSLLSDKYRIVVVEKAGYGFSDIVDIDRDIDNILSETREALLKAEISGPYILYPHSMSGIEALYWAQKYPGEVTAIIGLDMAVPESYEEYNIDIPLIKLSAFAANAGITRWIPGIWESDAIKYGTLTDEEKELYKVVFYRRTATKTMLNEVQEIKKNASIVKESGVPNVPILMFSSNGQGTGWNENEWRDFHKNYMKNTQDGEMVDLNCSHYVHDIEYKKIADETKKFIENLN
ncbi:alpha/beta hydrolase [Tissierella sp. MB52-C2]|uniref:alpha/beta fold hydrolase n=1 Tax=Tissierella sp. MB52-C2 TaxID=3070999 RepID=UPI00280B043C|nr:alpha/beta hydrolase [Tissierella sp. MB52-C2]WMM23897.1 alpha/beta hydrolase [Tissierella sp. MB52-C2]